MQLAFGRCVNALEVVSGGVHLLRIQPVRAWVLLLENGLQFAEQELVVSADGFWGLVRHLELVKGLFGFGLGFRVPGDRRYSGYH